MKEHHAATLMPLYFSPLLLGLMAIFPAASYGGTLWPPNPAGLDLKEITHSTQAIESKDDIRSALQLPFYRQLGVSGRSRALNNCAELLQLQGASEYFLEPALTSEAGTLADISTICIAADLNLKSQPSKRSHISEHPLDEDLIKHAPDTLGFYVNPEIEKPLAQRHGAVWADANVIKNIIQYDDNNTTLELDDAKQNLILVGRGDVNGDGIEDIILKLVDTLDPPATLFNTRLYVLTRLEANGPYTILKAYDQFSPIARDQ